MIKYLSFILTFFLQISVYTQQTTANYCVNLDTCRENSYNIEISISEFNKDTTLYFGIDIISADSIYTLSKSSSSGIYLSDPIDYYKADNYIGNYLMLQINLGNFVGLKHKVSEAKLQCKNGVSYNLFTTVKIL